MRLMMCKNLGETNNINCKECFSNMSNEEYRQELLGDFKPQTRAQCCQKNAEYLTEAYIALKEGEAKGPAERFLEKYFFDGKDEDTAFILDNEIWVNIIRMRKYIRAIKKFERCMIREGFERIDLKLLESMELDGIWYKRRVKG